MVDELSLDLDNDQSFREDNTSELNSKLNFRRKYEEV
jgi:hypothetical protein